MQNARVEIGFQFLLNQSKSDCIFHFPTDFEPNGITFAVPDKSEKEKYNLIQIELTRIRSRFLCSAFRKYWPLCRSDKHGETDPDLGQFKPEQDCNYIFPIDLAPNGIPCGFKSIGKV